VIVSSNNVGHAFCRPVGVAEFHDTGRCVEHVDDSRYVDDPEWADEGRIDIKKVSSSFS
jgi:hypothetical protein